MAEFVSSRATSESTETTVTTVRRTRGFNSSVQSDTTRKTGRIIIVREYDNNKQTELIPKAERKPEPTERVIIPRRKQVQNAEKEIVKLEDEIAPQRTQAQKSEIRKVEDEIKQEVKAEDQSREVIVSRNIQSAQSNQVITQEVTQIQSSETASNDGSTSSWTKAAMVSRFTVKSKSYSVKKKTFVSPGFGPKRWSVDTTAQNSQSLENLDDGISDTASNVSEPVTYGSLRRRKKFVCQPMEKSLEEMDTKPRNNGKQKFKIPSHEELSSANGKAEDVSFPSFLDQYRMGTDLTQQPLKDKLSDADPAQTMTISGAPQVQINERPYSVVNYNGKPRLITYVNSEKSKRGEGETEVSVICDSRPWFVARYLQAQQ